MRIPTWLINCALKENLYYLTKNETRYGCWETALGFCHVSSNNNNKRWVGDARYVEGTELGPWGTQHEEGSSEWGDSVTRVEDWTKQHQCDTESHSRSQWNCMPLIACWFSFCTHSKVSHSYHNSLHMRKLRHEDRRGHWILDSRDQGLECSRSFYNVPPLPSLQWQVPSGPWKGRGFLEEGKGGKLWLYEPSCLRDACYFPGVGTLNHVIREQAEVLWGRLWILCQPGFLPQRHVYPRTLYPRSNGKPCKGVTWLDPAIFLF